MTESEKRDAETLKVLSERFRIGEGIPFRGIQFRVAWISKDGIGLAPVGYTNSEIKKMKKRFA